MLQAEQVLQERYRLKQKLGQNAGRQTWLAEDMAIGDRETVIVKLLCFGGEVQWDDLKLFEREAQVLKQLNHPRIPRYRDYFSIDERYLWFGLVQEYIPGLSLKELLVQGKKFREQQVYQLAEDILHILIYLHKLNPPVLHRDIKPSNLIWGEDNQIYLVDFGAVQDKAAQEGATFTVVGTYGYAPMEQFGGRAVLASDLYALGATLVHLLTGIAPADLPQKDLRIQFREHVSVSPRFVRWLETLIEPALERRFSHASQALATLKSDAIIQSHAEQASLSYTGKIRRPSRSRVEVNTSLERLEILIPERAIKNSKTILKGIGITIGTLCWLLISSIMMAKGTLLFVPPLLGISIVLLVLTTQFFFQRTQVSLNRSSNHLELDWQLFNSTVFHKQGAVSDISYACCYSGENGARVLIRREDGSYYSFGQGLTEIECAWLAQEIQNWLNLG